MPTTRGRGDYITTGDKLTLRDNDNPVSIEAGGNTGPITLTLPEDATDTLVARNSTDTLTNKTLTNPTIDGGTITADIIGNASTASKLAATKNIAIAGEVAGSADFDGSQNITIDATVVDDTIDNDNIKADAGIARTKIAAGTANQVVINDGSGVFSSEAQLDISRGGTGESTAPAAFDALSPLTTKGDILVRTGSINGPSNVRLPVGTNNYVLAADSTTDNGVAWKPAADTGVLPLAGSDTQIQYNDNGQLGASSNFTYDASLGTLFIKGISSTSSTYALEIKDFQITTLFKLDNAGGITGSHITTASGTKLGRSAGRLNTNSSIVAIGVDAGRNNNNSGTDWTAVGYKAGYSNLIRGSWTAIGSLAGEANSTGQFWTALGYAAGKANTSGSSWTAIGLSAGTANTISGNWTALGTFAGSQSIVGGDWVALGYAAGTYDTASDPLEYFEKSVYIGSGAKGTNGTSGTPTTNETVIGYNAEGNGSNTVTIGNSAVTDNYFSGNGVFTNRVDITNAGDRRIAFKNNATSSLVETKLTASDGGFADQFGYSVSMSANGSTVIIGSLNENGGTGAAYIYKYNGTSWDETKLTASDGAFNDFFGKSVSMSADGNTVIIGASENDDNGFASGSAYVFRYSTITKQWTQQQKLTASDGLSNDLFGFSVAISADGNSVIVGAYFDDIGSNTRQGSAYVFRYNGLSWVQEQKLTASDGDIEDRFGQSVSMSADGNAVIVGAYFDDIGATTKQGSAYVYKYNGSTWVEEQKLTASNGDTESRFGYSVSMSADGNTIIIGSYKVDNPVLDSGSAYIFKYNGSTWVEEQILTGSNSSEENFFGFSVAISADGNTVIVGSIYGEKSVTDSGAAYIFKYNGLSWIEEQQIEASDGSSLDQFGISVSISADGNTTIVGADLESEKAYRAGSAYVFNIQEEAFTGSIFAESTGLASADLVFACDAETKTDVTNLSEKGRFTTDGNLNVKSGDVYTEGAGKGFVVTSPNGLIVKRIGIDNNGNIVVTNA